MVISTVRGQVAWALQKMVPTNDPAILAYVLEKTEALLDLNGKLSAKLGYPEPDYYVRLQAIVPLIELAHPVRRKVLENYRPGLGNKVKKLAFEIIKVSEKDFRLSTSNPVAIAWQLVHGFNFIRDLSTEEAKKVLDFFEIFEIDESYFLFIYFAIYRENQYKEIPFEPDFFRNKLKTLCTSNDSFRHKLAWHFWRVADENRNDKKRFNDIEEYWKLLFDHYQNQVFGDLYRTMEVTLLWPEKYDAHKELLKTAIRKEVEFFRAKKEPVQLWDLRGEIFQILKDRNDGDFLDVFWALLESVDENFYFYSMREWITIFSSIDSSNEAVNKDLHGKIALKLSELYPEDFRLK